MSYYAGNAAAARRAMLGDDDETYLIAYSQSRHMAPPAARRKYVGFASESPSGDSSFGGDWCKILFIFLFVVLVVAIIWLIITLFSCGRNRRCGQQSGCCSRCKKPQRECSCGCTGGDEKVFHNVQEFLFDDPSAAASTWTNHKGLKLQVELIGAGGGEGNDQALATMASGGGGGGAYGRYVANNIDYIDIVSVGLGGVANTAGGNSVVIVHFSNGQPALTLTANGGGAGAAGLATGVGGAGGTASSTFSFYEDGQNGGTGITDATSTSAGAGGDAGGFGGKGGIGGAVVGAGTPVAGTSGVLYGGGAGGINKVDTPTDGANGAIIITILN